MTKQETAAGRGRATRRCPFSSFSGSLIDSLCSNKQSQTPRKEADRPPVIWESEEKVGWAVTIFSQRGEKERNEHALSIWAVLRVAVFLSLIKYIPIQPTLIDSPFSLWRIVSAAGFAFFFWGQWREMIVIILYQSDCFRTMADLISSESRLSEDHLLPFITHFSYTLLRTQEGVLSSTPCLQTISSIPSVGNISSAYHQSMGMIFKKFTYFLKSCL